MFIIATVITKTQEIIQEKAICSVLAQHLAFVLHILLCLFPPSQILYCDIDILLLKLYSPLQKWPTMTFQASVHFILTKILVSNSDVVSHAEELLGPYVNIKDICDWSSCLSPKLNLSIESPFITFLTIVFFQIWSTGHRHQNHMGCMLNCGHSISFTAIPHT